MSTAAVLLALVALALVVGAGALTLAFWRSLGRSRDECASERRRADIAETRLAERERQITEQSTLLATAEHRLGATFASLGSQALADSNKQLLQLARESFEGLLARAQGDTEKKKQEIDALVTPIRDLMATQDRKLGEMHVEGEKARARLDEQLKQIGESHQKLHGETARLVSALKRPEQRGRWGETALRNVVELSGMKENCDFQEQITAAGDGANVRPDMLIRLPGGGRIVVDAKVAWDAYSDTLDPDADRKASMARHANQFETHVKSLGAKEYWKHFEPAPRLVVMFVPLESALVAALEVKPDLQQVALERNVLIASPTILIGLLRAIAHGWQQESLAVNAREIALAGRELYERLSKFLEKYDSVSTHLARAVSAYNDSAGSFEKMLLPSARRLKELHAGTERDVEAPSAIDAVPRTLAVPELRALPDR